MLIDLSMPLSPAAPVYPDDPTVEVRQVASIDAESFAAHKALLGAPARVVARVRG